MRPAAALYFRVVGCKQKDVLALDRVRRRVRHDQTGAVERVPERQADGGRGGDLPRREGHGAGVPERDPPLQGGEPAAPAAPQRDRPAAPAAAPR